MSSRCNQVVKVDRNWTEKRDCTYARRQVNKPMGQAQHSAVLKLIVASSG